jgi:hypothetical protein
MNTKLAIVSLALLVPRLALAQASPEPSTQTEQVAAQGDQAVAPPTEAPATAPAPPPKQPPAPPSAQAQKGQAAANPTGQWVYTNQYGWVWAPYGDQYVSATEGAAQPYEYVYEPDLGWTWLAAPWIWGWGPLPYWGVYGPWHFGWYGRYYGVGRWGGYHWGGAYGRGGFRGGGFGGHAVGSGHGGGGHGGGGHR